ncbi:Agenet-like domain-containing protein [Quillaja saponaria]|uniref:Agenet-like domain-containing protein n=1 Tax=Quillaja saponaria TaxID=32244 RepID=A0AAD7Q1Q0_QUISA|nr:Agenet-like domain-containing protein [Quillaja saponaria]
MSRPTKEQIELGKEDLRLHWEWLTGTWVPPLEEEKASITTEGKSSITMTEEKFSWETLVEVCSDEDGFQGPWFAVTIIEAKGKDKFLVEYQSLRTDGDAEFLRRRLIPCIYGPIHQKLQWLITFNFLKKLMLCTMIVGG